MSSETFEKLVGAFSFPSSIKSKLRFVEDRDGRLILRIYDYELLDWRDARTADLSPVSIDLMARREASSFRANTRGSGMGTRTALEQDNRKGKPRYVHSGEKPRDNTVTMIMPANFYVTDGVKYSTDSPLFDEEIERRDPVGIILARMRRVNQLMNMERV